MSLDHYNCNGNLFSLQDMIDLDVQSGVGESMFPSDVKLADLTTLSSQCFGSGSADGDVLRDVQLDNVDVLQVGMDSNVCSYVARGMDGANNASPCPMEAENTNPNLLVNPQTGMPIEVTFDQAVSLINTANCLSPTQHAPMTVGLQPPIQTTRVQYIQVPIPSPVQTVYVQRTPVTQMQNSVAGLIQTVPTTSAPAQQSPLLVEHLQTASRLQKKPSVVHAMETNRVQEQDSREKVYPKPVYSYSCLIAMALKNSEKGHLPVSEIYNFMIEHFPYFKTAPDGWKNSVRHNLSLNKCFEKADNPKLNGSARKGCLWALNPAKIEKMEDEIVKWRKKDPIAIRNSMSMPERLELIEQGRAGPPRMHVEGTPPGTPTHLHPAALRMQEIKTELFNGDLKEMHMLDPNFTVDPALSELAIQSGLWDDSDLNLDIPITSPSMLALPSGGYSCSPLTIQTSHAMGDAGFQSTIFTNNQPSNSIPLTIQTQPSHTLQSAQT